MSQLKKVFEEADEKYRLLTKIPEEFLSTPQEFRKRSEKLITTYKTECSVSENKHNESLAACLDTKEKKNKEINNDTKEKIRDLRDKRDKDLKISRKNVVKKLTKQQDLVFSFAVMILAIILLVLAVLMHLGFLINPKNPEGVVVRTKIAKAEEDYKFWSNPEWGDLEKVKELENKIKTLKSTEFDKSESFSIFVRKGGIQLVITIILLYGLIYLYIRKILLFNSHKKLIKSYSVDSSDHDNTSQAIKIDPDEDTDADAYYQEIAFKRRMKESDINVDSDKPPIATSVTPLPPTDTGSRVDRDPDSIPVVELMRICNDNPEEGISLIDNMSSESQQTDCTVLAKFLAYQMLATKPFIEAKIPLSSNPEEFMRGSQSDTIELCEKALEQIVKFESGNVTFTMWEKDNFKKSNPDNDPDDKTRADAVCTILDRLQPGRVQEILGRTRLSFFGVTRIGSVPGLNVNETVASESISCLQDILFEFPKVIRSVIAFEVKEKVVNGAKIVCCRVFEQATSESPKEDPGQCLGVLHLCEDGTCSYEVY